MLLSVHDTRSIVPSSLNHGAASSHSRVVTEDIQEIWGEALNANIPHGSCEEGCEEGAGDPL